MSRTQKVAKMVK